VDRRYSAAHACTHEEEVGDSQSERVTHGCLYVEALTKFPWNLNALVVFAAPPKDTPHMDDELDELHWSYVEKSRAAATPEGQADLLRATLAQLSLAEIAAYDHWFWQQMQLLYSWELWGVASLAGHDGEEPFLGFRAWIVSLGRSAALDATADADSLASFIFEGAEAPDFCHVGREAYEGKAGSELPTATLNLFAKPRGTPLQNSELTTRFPAVSAALAP
jgi:hypothetical protein